MYRFSFSQCFIAAALIVVMSAPLAAEPKMGLELVAGVNMDTLITDLPFSSVQTGTGYQLGALYHFVMDPRLTMSTGALFRLNLSKVTTLGQQLDSTCSFIEVPITFNYYLLDTFQVHAGGYYGIPLGKYDIKSGDTVLSSNDSNADFGILGGVGMVIGPVSFDITYKYGLADVNKGFSSHQLSSVSMTAGLMF